MLSLLTRPEQPEFHIVAHAGNAARRRHSQTPVHRERDLVGQL
jgi:hypothetical protein